MDGEKLVSACERAGWSFDDREAVLAMLDDPGSVRVCRGVLEILAMTRPARPKKGETPEEGAQ